MKLNAQTQLIAILIGMAVLVYLMRDKLGLGAKAPATAAAPATESTPAGGVSPEVAAIQDRIESLKASMSEPTPDNVTLNPVQAMDSRLPDYFKRTAAKYGRTNASTLAGKVFAVTLWVGREKGPENALWPYVEIYRKSGSSAAKAKILSDIETAGTFA